MGAFDSSILIVEWSRHLPRDASKLTLVLRFTVKAVYNLKNSYSGGVTSGLHWLFYQLITRSVVCTPSAALWVIPLTSAR